MTWESGHDLGSVPSVVVAGAGAPLGAEVLMKISPQQLDDIKRRVSLGSLIARHVTLKRAGRELTGLCPFHREKTPSFTVNEEKGFFHCFGCGAHGDQVSFLMQREGLSFVEAVQRLAADGGADDPTADEERRRRDREAEERRRRERQERATRETARAIDIVRGGRPAAGTPVQVFLRSRGLVIPPPPTLRHGRLPYWDHDAKGRRIQVGIWDVMIAPVQRRDRSLCAVHLTYLAPGGAGKAEIIHPETGEVLPPRKMRGPTWGGAVRLAPVAARLGEGEGIESCLSVQQETGLPCWAALSLGNLAGAGLGRGAPHPTKTRMLADGREVPTRLPSSVPDPRRPGFLPPDGVQESILLAERGNGDDAAYACLLECAVRRRQAAGLTVRVAWPDQGDFNDVLQGIG